MHNLDSVELVLSSDDDLDPDIDPGPHHLRPDYDAEVIYWIYAIAVKKE